MFPFPIENIVLERYGSKALRIFRVIRQKLQCEESTLQNFVMIPAKETKLLTYKLLEANFIKIQELRKSMASNMGKTFFLFYVDLPQGIANARCIFRTDFSNISNFYCYCDRFILVSYILGALISIQYPLFEVK